MKRWKLLLIPAAGLIGLVAWKAFPSVPPVLSPPKPVAQAAPDAFLATTWNVGLAPGFVPHTSLRTPQVAHEAIRLRDHDAVCIQEAWDETTKQEIMNAVALPAANVYMIDSRGWNDDPSHVCDADRLDSVKRCLDKRCAGIDGEDLTACGREHCLLTLGWIQEWDPGCATCLIASAGKSRAEVRAACGGKGSSRYRDGSNGLILFSKHPLENVEVKDMPASGANKPVLFARIRGVEVACTHMTSTTDGKEPLEKRFKTWDDEQAYQIDLISSRLDERALGGPQILIGDLNFGPPLAPPAIKTYGGGTWERFVKLGFRSPVVEHQPPMCSICNDNLIRNAAIGGIIDHAAFRGPGLAPIYTERFAERHIYVVDGKGRTVETNLSDHYGITTRFRITQK